MKSMNKAQLIGYLGKNPEIRDYTPGKAFATIRLVTNTFFHRSEGESVKYTEWHIKIPIARQGYD